MPFLSGTTTCHFYKFSYLIVNEIGISSSDSACDLSHSVEDKVYRQGLENDIGGNGVRRADTLDEATLLADIAALQSTEELAQYW